MDSEETRFGSSPGWADDERRNQKPETTMERLQARLLNVDRLPFDGFPAPNTIVEGADPDLWSGRFWLPAGKGVEPTRNFCLLSGDGRVGEMIMDRFALREPQRPVAGFMKCLEKSTEVKLTAMIPVS
jgi:hypothetical protein